MAPGARGSAAASARRGRRRRRGHLGARDREAACENRLYSPMPPEASGIADYSALLLPALRGHVDVIVLKRGAKRPSRCRSPSTTLATTPPRTAGSSTPSGGLRARRAARLRAPPPRRRSHHRASRRARLPRRDGARARRGREAARARRARQAAAPLWEYRPRTSRWPARSSACDGPRRPLAARREARAAGFVLRSPASRTRLARARDCARG